MSDQDSEQHISETPPDIRERKTNVINDLLPAKSRKQYEKSYQDFMEWRTAKNTPSLSEHLLLAYFEEMSTKFKSTSMWTFYSMLKSTLNIKHNVDIAKYSKLTAFLKQKHEGNTTVKKAKTFSPHEIDKFLKEAPDKLYLMTKVGFIFGIVGACRRQELFNVMFNDVKVFESTIFVTIRNTQTKTHRTFTITGSYCQLVKKYIRLRPKPCPEPCFFVHYLRGKCSTKKVGLNKFGCLGKTIAEFLDLPNPEMYTGHSLRRTSATIIVDAGGERTELKRLSVRHSTTTAEGYIDESIQNKQLPLNKTDNKHYQAVLKCCVDLVKVHGRPVEMFNDQAFRDILDMVPHLSKKHRKKLTTENIKMIIENNGKTGDDNGTDLDDTDMDRDFDTSNEQYPVKGEIIVETLGCTCDAFAQAEGSGVARHQAACPAAENQPYWNSFEDDTDRDMDTSNDQFPVKREIIAEESLECTCDALAQAEDSGVVRHQASCPAALSQRYRNFFEVSLDSAKCTICGNVISWSDINTLKKHLMEVHPAVEIVDDDTDFYNGPGVASSVASAEDFHEVYLEDGLFERPKISPPRKRMRTLIQPPKVVDRHGVEISLERFESLERFGLYVASLLKLIPKVKCRQFQVQIVERLIQEQAAAA